MRLLNVPLWLKHHWHDQDARRQQARFALELGTDLPTVGSRLPGDNAALRGLPAIGIGVSGAIAGTDPERELLRKERRQQAEIGVQVIGDYQPGRPGGAAGR